jgi:exodeoxyribonuclease VII small subunit
VTPSDLDPDPDLDSTPSYADAVAQLETILEELEDDTLDVDVLATRVKEAAELLRLCRQRLDAARIDIEHVMADLDDDAVVDSAP